MLRLLPGGSAARIRTLAKFMEKDYEKIDKLVKLRRDYASRTRPVEEIIEKERKSLSKEDQEVMGAEWLSRRLDAGLFSLQVWKISLSYEFSLYANLLLDDRCYSRLVSCRRRWR